MNVNPNDLTDKQIYKFMSGMVIPRPIAWVSTISEAGVPNVAPYSYFNAVCSQPPTLLFCAGFRDSHSPNKDTYNNIVATGEFSVNFVNEATANAMHITADGVPPEVDEFERAGLTAAPGKVIVAPYVVESPAHFECKLREIVTIGEHPGGGHIIIGTVVHMRFNDSIVRDGTSIDVEAYQPVGRLSGSAYAHINDVFELKRP